jgi:L-fuculose-phosphate aldolase
MKTIISAKDVEALLRQGGDVNSLPADAIVTPSARDLINAAKAGSTLAGQAGKSPSSVAPVSGKAASPVTAQSSTAGLDRFFNSPAIQALKLEICEVGHRLWQRAYVDGNGGNISIRVADDLVLCTPTLVSKGSLKPDDLCLVDMEGNQKAGNKKRTSEILMHLQIMKAQPKAKACVHAHPPYSTAFAVAGIEPPTCMIPEYEVFCAVAIAPYRTPGSPEMGKLVADLVDKHNTILMSNHGVVTWSHNNVEEAYWRMEIIEAYCRTLTVAAQLGKPLNTFTPDQLKDLLKIKQSLGFVDPRFGLKECELCDNSEWRPGVVCQLPSKESPTVQTDPSTEALVQAITDMILNKMKG